MSSTDTNPFGTALSNDKVSPSLQSDKSTNLWMDLLSGDDGVSESISTPVIRNSVHEGGDLLDFLDDFVQEPVENDSKSTPSQEEMPLDKSAHQYLNTFRFLAGQQMVCYNMMNGLFDLTIILNII